MDPGARWFGQQAVYRISLGNFLFFGGRQRARACVCRTRPKLLVGPGLSAALVGVQYTSDRRDRMLHHGSWSIKALLWAVANVVPFFLPNGLVWAYSYLARAGSAVFIFVQILLLIDVSHAWNDAWVEQGDDRLLYALAGITGAAYTGGWTDGSLTPARAARFSVPRQAPW